MYDKPIANLIRPSRVVDPDDSIGRAMEYMRVSGLAVLPVVSMGKLSGVVKEEALLNAAVTGNPLSMQELRVRGAMTDESAAVYAWTPIAEAAEVMDRHGMQAIPVVSEYGDYLGIVSRGDIIGALALTLKPASIAGMATPLGVYLTTGNIRSGAGDLGLFLAGVALMTMNYVAMGAILGMAWIVQHATSLHLWDIMTSTDMSMPAWVETARVIMYGLSLPVFLLLMRISPLAGYHAAEHQVVHAIENGEPLKAEYVSMMPRVHPRCGTNIVAAMIIFLMISQIAGTEAALMITVLIVAFAWKSIGGFLQNYITTRPASPRQMENGIRAGENLLERFRMNPSYSIGGWKRLWYAGMPQMMLGVAAVSLIAEMAQNIAPRLF